MPNWNAFGRSIGLNPVFVSLFVCGLNLCSSNALSHENESSDYTDFSIFELLEMEVSIVNAKRDKLSESQAAVSVISAEQIRRSGYTNLPDLLRSIPGFHVGSINSQKWSVSSRGFGGLWSSKLLVLMDGRSLYSPIFGGVYWDMQTIALDNIEQIEVIRGPGASVWGSNSVTGVINIITKQPGLGNAPSHEIALNYSDNRNRLLKYSFDDGVDNFSYRVSVHHNDFNEADQPHDSPVEQNNQRKNELNLSLRWSEHEHAEHSMNIGAIDAERTSLSLMPSLEPPFFHTILPTIGFSNQFINYRYSQKGLNNDDLLLQVIVDKVSRDGIEGQFDQVSYELNYRHGASLDVNHLNWGLSYKHQKDEYDNAFVVSMIPEEHSDKEFTGFIQDEIHFADNHGDLILGAKYEYVPDHENHIQPSVRLGYLTEGGVYWWGAVSKAFRAVTRADRDMQLNFAVFPGRNGQLMVLQRLGNEHKKSEKLLAWEIGLRYKFSDWWNFELNGFYNDFDRLTSSEPVDPYCFYGQGPPPCTAGDLLAVASRFGNEMNGHSSGIEMQMSYAVKEKLKLSASYSLLSQEFHLTPLSQDIGAAEELRRSVPKHQFKARLDWDILENLQLTASSYYSSPVQSVQTMGMLSVDNHWRFDARVGWQLLPDVELYLSGISLFDKHYLEYSTNDGSLPTYIERSFSLGMQWQF